MAIRARLAAPPVLPPETWPYHVAKHTSLPAHLLWRGDRRMEAETYLSSGYGIKLAIEERAVGWQRLGQMASLTMPNRTKGTLVAPEYGIPWLAATQVFDIRPVPRKWLATEKIKDFSALFVTPGTILVTRSGNVGRSTIATNALKNTLASDDLLRVQARDPEQWGWIYAYLRSPQARAMMSGAHYGHIIKHLETSHLDALPVPVVRPEIASDFRKRTQTVLDLRNRAQDSANEAESRFQAALGSLKVKDWGESGFAVSSAAFFKTRRRFEAAANNPGAATIFRHLSKHGSGFATIDQLGYKVWVPSRYKRIPAENGVIYYDSADLLETNPDTVKRFAECGFGDEYNGRVARNWLLMPCSGQVYGIIGNAVLAGDSLDGQVVSNHVIRIVPLASKNVREGYLLTALTHPVFGRPLIKSLAFGSSVPELDPSEIREFPVVRLSPEEEDSIANLAEEAAELRARADVLERELAEEAGKYIEKFLAGDMVHFVTTMPTLHEIGLANPAALPEHGRVRLLRARTKAGLPKGAEGTIVHVYEEDGYEVEFIAGLKRPVVLTLEADEIEEVRADS
jgi:hypothetical protein